MQFDRFQYIYFITFDYYSALFEVDKLETTDFRTVVEKLKMQFNLHGIPEIFVSNNSPKYDSCEFSKLAEFSAYNPQSNGKVESAIKNLRKHHEEGCSGKLWSLSVPLRLSQHT